MTTKRLVLVETTVHMGTVLAYVETRGRDGKVHATYVEAVCYEAICDKVRELFPYEIYLKLFVQKPYSDVLESEGEEGWVSMADVVIWQHRCSNAKALASKLY